MDFRKGIRVRTSHGGVVGSPMMCTKMDQNRPSLMLEIIGLSSRCALLSIIKPLKRNFWFVGTTIFPHFGPWLVVCPFNQFNLIIFVTQDKFETLLLCHAMGTILVNIGLFWSILVHIMDDPTTPLWLVLTPILFQVPILSRKGSY